MTKVIKTIVYGEGGFDDSKPDDNVIEIEYYSKEELAQIKIENDKIAAKNALLEKLGITEEEAKLLLG